MLTRDQKYGRLEYHVPSFFFVKRPAIGYSNETHNMSIRDHPLGSRLPEASSKPAVVCDPEEFKGFIPAHMPRELSDYLYSDRPQLHLHVVSFTDATLVFLSWPHSLMDAMGRKSLLEAWIATLSGREQDVLPLHGISQDPMKMVGKNITEPYKLGHLLFTSWQMLLFAFVYVWKKTFYKEEETRMVCMPSWFVKSLRATTTKSLVAKTGNKSAFLSDGDVLTAWIVRLAVSHMPRTSNRTVMIGNAFGLRSTFANDLLPKNKAYIGNATTTVSTRLTVRDLLTRPLSYAAAAVRESLVQLGTREQLEARIGLDMSHYKTAGFVPLYGDASMEIFTCSNWAKGGFFGMDFSAAVVARQEIAAAGADDDDDDDDKNKNNLRQTNLVGRPSYIQPIGFVKNYPSHNSFQIIGKDAQGNYWWSGTLRKGLWAGIEETLRKSA
ncbi:hypothetical protein F4778DRAFT_739235 [Xylariomycetidae sp. FL2044]|nr:hypothetical protein F4778DRAFT_739235 [Xylariomycetidae sp. FL2044]